jgi:hypothetical protein
VTRLLQENWFRTTKSFGYSYGERRKFYPVQWPARFWKNMRGTVGSPFLQDKLNFQVCYYWQVIEWATFAAGRILLRSELKHSLKSCLTYVCRSCKRFWRGVSSRIFFCQDGSFGREHLVLRNPVERQV